MITNKNLFFALGLFTLFGFSAIGWLLIYFFIDVPFGSIFFHGEAWFYQILIGLIYGALTGWLGWQIVKSKLLEATRQHYGGLI